MSMPLWSKIVSLLLFFLFAFALFVLQDPRDWRRLFYEFLGKGDLSVNENKRIDEQIIRYGYLVVGILLTASIVVLILGLLIKYGENVP